MGETIFGQLSGGCLRQVTPTTTRQGRGDNPVTPSQTAYCCVGGKALPTVCCPCSCHFHRPRRRLCAAYHLPAVRAASSIAFVRRPTRCCCVLQEAKARRETLCCLLTCPQLESAHLCGCCVRPDVICLTLERAPVRTQEPLLSHSQTAGCQRNILSASAPRRWTWLSNCRCRYEGTSLLLSMLFVDKCAALASVQAGRCDYV